MHGLRRSLYVSAVSASPPASTPTAYASGPAPAIASATLAAATFASALAAAALAATALATALAAAAAAALVDWKASVGRRLAVSWPRRRGEDESWRLASWLIPSD